MDALALVPAFLLVITMSGRGPIRNALLGLAVCGATALSSSWHTWFGNLRDLSSYRLVWPAIGAVIALLVIGSALRTRFQRLGDDQRIWTLIAAVAVPFLSGVLLLQLKLHHPISGYYGSVMIVPAAVAIALLTRQLLDRVVRAGSALAGAIPAGASVAVLFYAIIPAGEARAESAKGWTYPDARAVAAVATRLGWSYDRTLLQVEGRGCEDITGALGVYLPPPDRKPIDESQALHVEFGSGQQEKVALERGGFASIHQAPTWLRLRQALACYASSAADPSPECERVGTGSGAFTFAHRAFPTFHSLKPRPSFVARYSIPIVPEGNDRTVRLYDDSDPACAWRITEVHGLDVRGKLPAQSVALRSSGEGGLLVIEHPFGAPCPPPLPGPVAPPCFDETDGSAP
jgi:hypothetical protein